MERKPPMTLQMFMGGDLARARYWARSMIGWRRFGRVLPNDSHRRWRGWNRAAGSACW